MNQENTNLLGDGNDLTGRSVSYFGSVWIISGKNYLGDWDVERFETRETGRVKVSSSISALSLSEDHPHHACLLPEVNDNLIDDDRSPSIMKLT